MINNVHGALLLAVSVGGVCDPAGPETPPGFQGVVEYEERTLAFEVPGRVRELAVDEGVVLEPDAVIGRLDDTLERLARDARSAEAEAVRKQVELLEAGSRPEDIKGLRASLRSAKSAEALARRTAGRERKLEQRGIGRGADLDAALTAEATAKARRQEIEQALARARRGARSQEIEAAHAQAESADVAVSLSTARIDRHVLHASHAGHVLEVHQEEGEFVGIGTPIVTMADLSRPYVDVFVPQGRVDEAVVGAAATVRIDAHTEPLVGRVEHIGRRTEFTPKFLFSERERPNLVLRVRVRVDDPEHVLRAGVPAFAVLESK